MEQYFLKALEGRRSIYGLGNKPGVPDEEILELVRRAVKASPSAFNSQGGRVAVLFGGQHEKLWNDTLEILRGVAPAEGFESTEEKIHSFRAGHGTVLFFEDQDIVRGLQENFPLYRDNFPVWSLESAGMLQLAVWTALEEAGLGASLQHYNPLIDGGVRETLRLPQSWKLLAQMPFGNVTAAPDPKDFLPVDQRVKIFR